MVWNGILDRSGNDFTYYKEGFPMKKLSKKVESLIGLASKSDVNGSYTGKPLNPKEKPVQDADDL